MERGKDGKSAKLMARWLDCKGKMEAKKRETDQGQSDRKEDGKREGRAQKTEGRMKERVGGNRKRGRGDGGYWDMETEREKGGLDDWNDNDRME